MDVLLLKGSICIVGPLDRKTIRQFLGKGLGENAGRDPAWHVICGYKPCSKRIFEGEMVLVIVRKRDKNLRAAFCSAECNRRHFFEYRANPTYSAHLHKTRSD